jgi:hypothetical protein
MLSLQQYPATIQKNIQNLIMLEKQTRKDAHTVLNLLQQQKVGSSYGKNLTQNGAC